METGKVEAIIVGNGAIVRAGEVLVELDRSAALADAKSARAELASAQAEILRRKTALLSARSHRFDPAPAIDWPENERRRCASAKPVFSPPISGNWRRTSPHSTPSGRKRPPKATN